MNIPKEISSIDTFDIASCYEAIPHQGEFSLLWALQEICNIGSKLGYMGFGLNKNLEPSLLKKPKKDYKLFRFDEFVILNQIILQSCFVQLGPIMVKQVKGIPMGYSCSPLWCNLYFAAYLKLTLLKDYLNFPCFKNLKHLNFRFGTLTIWHSLIIVLLLNSSMRNEACTNDNPKWIYPLHIIQLKPTATYHNHITTNAVFLCAKFTLHRPFIGNFSSSINWKKDKLPCNNVSYLFLKSNRPIKQCYNVCISQVVTILYAASHCFLAFQDLNKLIYLLKNNGFHKNTLIHIIYSYILENEFPGIHFDKSLLLKMINDFGGE